mmetsp:Transcript_7303/g.26089  ORF Transcript_7303/g.26089 Transcript_7303/m.26089 type:complete len:103 (-) Transcript_7303:203-511(-)
MVGVCGASSCHFAFDVRRQRKASGDGFEWKLCKFVPHDALCGKLRAPTAGAEPAKKPRVAKRKERRCAYSSADLGRFLPPLLSAAAREFDFGLPSLSDTGGI